MQRSGMSEKPDPLRLLLDKPVSRHTIPIRNSYTNVHRLLQACPMHEPLVFNTRLDNFGDRVRCLTKRSRATAPYSTLKTTVWCAAVAVVAVHLVDL